MKKFVFLSLVAAPALLHAEAKIPADRPFFKSTPPPIYTVKTETTVTTQTTVQPTPTYVYDQKPLAGVPVLVTKEQADEVVKKFKAIYPNLGKPRILVYVNRELVDTESGMRLTSRSETVNTTRSKVDSTIEAPAHSTSGSVTINAGHDVSVGSHHDYDYPGKGKITRKTDNIRTENRYSTKDQKQALADKQTVRDVERLFGRPLRAAGATLADQRTATQLIANRPIKQMLANTEGEQARKDREALKNIADVAIEILISSRNVTIPDVSGDKSYSAPDIQATAISLNDSRILGQASSRDVVGKDRFAGRVLRNFDVQEIAEATALALMEDMTLGQK